MNDEWIYMIDVRGKRRKIPHSEVEARREAGWIYKPDADQEYYPELDQSLVQIRRIEMLDNVDATNILDIEVI